MVGANQLLVFPVELGLEILLGYLLHVKEMVSVSFYMEQAQKDTLKIGQGYLYGGSEEKPGVCMYMKCMHLSYTTDIATPYPQEPHSWVLGYGK